MLGELTDIGTMLQGIDTVDKLERTRASCVLGRRFEERVSWLYIPVRVYPVNEIVVS